MLEGWPEDERLVQLSCYMIVNPYTPGPSLGASCIRVGYGTVGILGRGAITVRFIDPRETRKEEPFRRVRFRFPVDLAEEKDFPGVHARLGGMPRPASPNPVAFLQTVLITLPLAMTYP